MAIDWQIRSIVEGRGDSIILAPAEEGRQKVHLILRGDQERYDLMPGQVVLAQPAIEGSTFVIFTCQPYPSISDRRMEVHKKKQSGLEILWGLRFFEIRTARPSRKLRNLPDDWVEARSPNGDRLLIRVGCEVQVLEHFGIETPVGSPASAATA